MRLLALIAILLVSPFLSSFAAENESVYDRVMRTGVIKCGYIIYPPAILKDPNTGEISGVFHDLMEEAAKRLSLKVEWTVETGWANFINELKSDRFDMMCGTGWANSARGREASPLKPLYYSGVYAWVKADDTRFDKSLSAINHPDRKVATIDGSTSDLVARADFPKAQVVSLTELSAYSDLPLAVTTGKADATFIEKYAAELFLQSNPGTIKNIGTPLRVYGNVMWVKKGQEDFKEMVDLAMEEILNTNFLEQTFKKYEVPPNAYYPAVKPYEAKP